MRYLFSGACVAAVLVFAVGCPNNEMPAKAFILVSGNATGPAYDSGAKAGVPLADIASLKVTVTEVVLDGRNNAGEGEGEFIVRDGDDVVDPEVSKVVVFSGEKQIDLRDLSGVSEILSEASIEPGTYTKIRLSIKDPILTQTSDPETEITDIQLTANGRLFISETFEVGEGGSLILLDFQGLHLVQTGNGKLVWTPQLRADISVESAGVSTTGTVESVDAAANTMTLTVADSATSVSVNFSAALIYMVGDLDVATGTPADLVLGASVIVEGSLSVSGEITATAIRIQ